MDIIFGMWIGTNPKGLTTPTDDISMGSKIPLNFGFHILSIPEFQSLGWFAFCFII